MQDLTALARAARRGDDRAQESFVAAAYPEVRRFCAALVDAQSADDLAQDTFIRALRTLPRFRGDSSARTWLLTVARNTCIDHLRTRARRRAESTEAQTGAGPAVAGPAGQVELERLLDRLSPERSSAFVLTQVIGLSYQDTAMICGCPVGTVRSRVARARAELIAALGAADAAVHSHT